MNQHYVPKVYLKNFAEYDGKAYFVNVYDKIKNKHFRRNIKKICAEIDLYTLDDDNSVGSHKLVVEKIYSDFIEPMYARAYSILIDDTIFQITDLERIEILVGVFQLYFRNPIIFRKNLDAHVLNIERLYEKNKADGIKGLTYLDEDFSFKEWDLGQIQKAVIDISLKIFKEQHIQVTAEISAIHEFAIIQVEKIIDNSADFLTNDNPLYLEDILAQNKTPFLKSSEFVLPINKKYAVTIFHDNTKKLNYIYRRKILNGNVNDINNSIYHNSSRFVIGDKETFAELDRLNDFFLKNDNIETKMEIIKQILANDKFAEESPEGVQLFKHYYSKFLQKNKLTKQEEYEMHYQMRILSMEYKKRKTQ